MKSPAHKQKDCLHGTGIIIGIAFALIFVGVRIFSENQYEAIYRLDPSGIIPPIWLLNLISLVWFFLIGYGAGSIIDSAPCKKGNCKDELNICQGAIAFTICFFLSHISYTIFFEGKHIVIAILMTLSAIVCSIISMLLWSSIKKDAALIMGGYCLWLFYLFIIFSSVLLHI